VERYVALLRGINVGTAKSVDMADLGACFEALGFANVRTLLRSGNVVFDGDGPVEAEALEEAIVAATGVSAAVVLVGERRFREIVAANPLAEVATDPSRALVTFVGGTIPDVAGLRRPSDEELLPERLVVEPDANYQWCPDGISRSKLPQRFFTSLGVTATARNLRTVEKLIAMLDGPNA
jgi:uncharacterized protein (DUF1697 family)